jgi:hypothetical protein
MHGEGRVGGWARLHHTPPSGEGGLGERRKGRRRERRKCMHLNIYSEREGDDI